MCSVPTVTRPVRRSRRHARRAQTHLVVVAKRDWAGGWRSLALVWGLPGLAMMLATLLEPLARAVVWTAALVWMGGACLANARRCSRTHCRFTGPFFILMAVAVVGYASGYLRLGLHGWSVLSGVTLIGALAIWWATERIWGKFLATTASAKQNADLIGG